MVAEKRGVLAGVLGILLISASASAQTAREDGARTGPISGYMEMHVNAPLDRADGDAISTFTASS